MSLPMGILSNGNCDFQRDQERDGIGSFFQWTLSAVDVGDSKPGLMGFLACIQLLGNLPPQRILFVGDDLDRDGLGARRAGMKTALLVRDVAEYQRLLEDPEPQQYDFLLNNLTPEHLHSVLKLPE
jgi:putative hydrolase of the HAD superfamily